jgi:hypothetical protein
MKTKKTAILRALAAVIVGCLFLLGTASGNAAPSDEQITVSGVVRAAEMSSRGEIRRVYIDTKDEAIAVSRRDKGKELLGQVGAAIQATGYLRKTWNDENFKRVIDVTEYVLQENANETRVR